MIWRHFQQDIFTPEFLRKAQALFAKSDDLQNFSCCRFVSRSFFIGKHLYLYEP